MREIVPVLGRERVEGYWGKGGVRETDERTERLRRVDITWDSVGTCVAAFMLASESTSTIFSYTYPSRTTEMSAENPELIELT